MKMYKTTEVAKLLGVTYQAVIQMVKRGDIKGFKAGQWRIPSKDLEELTSLTEEEIDKAIFGE